MTQEDRKKKLFLLKTLPQLINSLEVNVEKQQINAIKSNDLHWLELIQNHKNDITNLKIELQKARR